MRRNDRMIEREEAMDILFKGEYGILSTVDEAGQPYGVPLNYVVKNNFIYYHGTNAGGKKQENIRVNRRVWFTVIGSTKVEPQLFGTKYESAMVMGEAQLVENEEERIMALREFLYKYSPDYIEGGEKYIKASEGKTAIVKVSIDSLTGKRKA